MRTVARLEEKLQREQQEIERKNNIISDLADEVAKLQLQIRRSSLNGQNSRFVPEG